jgi:hypothetical protein
LFCFQHFLRRLLLVTSNEALLVTSKEALLVPEKDTHCSRTGGKFVVADQKIVGRNKAHCIYIQNKAES